MKPVNITFILPNNFNCFLSVLETLLTIPRYEKHFIVNPRCLIMISLFWNTSYLVNQICNMFLDDIRMALNCMLKMFQIDKYWCVECNPLIKTGVSDPIIHTSKVKIKGVSKGSWCYHHKFKCHKDANDGRGLRVFRYAKGQVFFTHIESEPKVEEIKYDWQESYSYKI